jgi:arsenate reductase
VDDVEAYSGGTEGTALNPRAAAALVRTGVAIEPRASDERSDNPRYEVRFGRGERLICFSKAYDQDPNPKSDFAAVMVCAEADENCPNIAGAQVRISLPYVDPKAADGTPGEAEAYDQRCAQIAREMLFVFAEVSKTR